MRILVLAHGLPPLAQGGAEIYADEHARALARLSGDDVHVVAREGRGDRPEYAVRTERRERFTITWVNNTFGAVRTYEESYRHPAVARIAERVIEEVRPDVAHIHHLTCLSTEIPGLLAARGIPVVCTLHDYWLLCHRGQLLDVDYRRCDGPEPSGCGHCLGGAAVPAPAVLVPALRALERALPRGVTGAARALTERLPHPEPAERRRLEHMRAVCGHVSRFLAPSRHIRDRFLRFGIAPDRIDWWPYGFNHGWAGHTPRPARGPILRIGFLGTLMASKAPHTLLEAFATLPPGRASVDLIGEAADYHGDATYRGVLAPLLGLTGVRAVGAQPRERIPDLLRQIDVLVVPSVWPETSPLVVREAFLTGVPVVASNVGGIPELVRHDDNGLLFEPGDVDGLRRALARLLDEPGLLARLAAGAAATSVRSIDEDAAAARQLYEALVASRPRARVGRRVAAVVLHFASADDTAIAVGSLLASDRPLDQIIVVDNDETRGCWPALARWADSITYLRPEGNLGFAGGMNLGIRHALDAGADAVLLVNNDVVVPPDCLGRLEAALAHGIGIVGPVVLSRASPGIVGSHGIDYNVRTGRMRHRAAGAPAAARVSDEDVDAVSGCLMLISREVFERVGLFDDAYFFGFEEIDLCLRARAAGIRTRRVGAASAYHEGGHAIGARSSRRLYFAARNHLMLARRHAGEAGALVRRARAAFVAGLNLAHAARTPGDSVAVRLAATFRGIRDYLAGRSGAGPF